MLWWRKCPTTRMVTIEHFRHWNDLVISFKLVFSISRRNTGLKWTVKSYNDSFRQQLYFQLHWIKLWTPNMRDIVLQCFKKKCHEKVKSSLLHRITSIFPIYYISFSSSRHIHNPTCEAGAGDWWVWGHNVINSRFPANKEKIKCYSRLHWILPNPLIKK